MKQRLVNFLHRNLLNAISADDIITINKNVIYLGGKPITDNELKQLQAEVKALQGFRIWGILSTSIKHIAQDKIFNKSVNFDDVTYGKAMLFNIETQESIVRMIKNKK